MCNLVCSPGQLPPGGLPVGGVEADVDDRVDEGSQPAHYIGRNVGLQTWSRIGRPNLDLRKPCEKGDGHQGFG